MSGMNLDVPDEYDEWPHDARSFVLAESNTAVDLREEINSLAGMAGEFESANAGLFTKEDLAELVIALGGPQRGGGA